jgi:malate permease and related proteins
LQQYTGMNQPSVLLALFFLGIIAQSFSFLPNDFFRKINRFIIFIPLPAITLAKVPHLHITSAVLFPIASAWIIFFGCILYALAIGKWLGWSRKTIACIILCCGLGNTSFVGYPFLQYFYGEQSIQYAIFVDQPGSFLIMSTFGVLIAAYFSSSGYDYMDIAKRILKFPPFIVFILALFMPQKLIEGNLLTALNFTGSFMVPLAILSLGLQFKLQLKEIEWRNFFAGVMYKLILAPLIIYVLFYFLITQKTELHTISIIECAMPPMITSSLLATEYELDEKLAGILPTLGIVAAVPTLLFWNWILR